jgi:hypothetical protein
LIKGQKIKIHITRGRKNPRCAKSAADHLDHALLRILARVFDQMLD